jgi:hypothetical protein
MTGATGVSGSSGTVPLTAADSGDDQPYVGHNRISSQALTSVAQAVAGEVLQVPAHQVRVTWTDDQGYLALALAMPIGIPPLAKVARDPSLVQGFGGTIRTRGHAAKPVILERVSRLSGSLLSRVDIRFTGVFTVEGGRVR